jgi:hypothetical protein
MDRLVRTSFPCEISGSSGGEYEDDSLLEAINTSETSFNVYETTRRNIAEDSHLQLPTNYLCVVFMAQSCTEPVKQFCLACRILLNTLYYIVVANEDSTMLKLGTILSHL